MFPFILLVALAACGGGGGTSNSSSSGGGPPVQPTNPPTAAPTSTPNPFIKHIVIIVQENRSFDNLFATYPGANGARVGKRKTGMVRLKEQPLKDQLDIHHIWQTFTTEYDNGAMDGFGSIAFTNGQPAGNWPYQYVDPQQIAPYWTMAKEYTLSDEMFETQSSGSFVAHQDLIAGDTAITSDEVLVNIPTREPWGCDAPKAPSNPPTTVTSLLKAPRQFLGNQGPFPCLTYRTLRDTLDEKNVPWKYYAPTFDFKSGGWLWTAFDAIRAVRYGPEWKTNVITPETTVLSDAAAGNLPAVSWVIP
ncbi:MAG TPA: alkaline phosphatase family protein, partial [Candidatus Acidoferrum sp.]|nr:alkaline phosphatase family protein [Candidatus Acidoferrum sp.]